MKKRFLSLIIGLCSMLPILAGSTLPLKLVNNSVYADNEIYVAIIGNYNGNTIYYDLKNNYQNNASLPVLNESVNTLTKAGQPWGFANIFTTLDQIKDKTIHLTMITSRGLLPNAYSRSVQSEIVLGDLFDS